MDGTISFLDETETLAYFVSAIDSGVWFSNYVFFFNYLSGK